MPVLRPMTQPEYAAWLAATIPEYAADKVASGQWAEDAALELSKKEYGELLPQGPEDEVRKLGLFGIALHVFGHNNGAQALYAKLGYQPTNISLFKPIGLTVDSPDELSRNEERQVLAVDDEYVAKM